MNVKWKRVLYFGGGGLGLLGIIFVALCLNSYSEELDFSQFTPSTWFLIILLSILYGAANLFLAAAWGKLLLYFDGPISTAQMIRLFGLSQLAKYLPGNIFHLAGRQALGMATGLPAKVLAKSALWELGGFVVAGTLFAPIIAPLVIPIGLSLGLLAAALCACLVVRRQFAATVSDALLYQCSFLAISGVIFVAILGLVSPQSSSVSLFPALCGALCYFVVGRVCDAGRTGWSGCARTGAIFFTQRASFRNRFATRSGTRSLYYNIRRFDIFLCSFYSE